jgi:mycobactin lysine-N-oxygenase
MHVGAADGGKAVRVDYDSADGLLERRFDYAVNCTGFDLLGQLRDFFSPVARAEIEAGSGPLWDGPPPVEIPIGRTLALEGVLPRIYIPGLAGVSQGPGFANLGSLGLMSNRVLMPFLLDEDELEAEAGAGSRAATVTD